MHYSSTNVCTCTCTCIYRCTCTCISVSIMFLIKRHPRITSRRRRGSSTPSTSKTITKHIHTYSSKTTSCPARRKRTKTIVKPRRGGARSSGWSISKVKIWRTIRYRRRGFCIGGWSLEYCGRGRFWF